MGQGILQALNFVIGFLLIRWMSVEAYAQYGVVFGFQSTLGMLVDLGFSGCIVSLVGNRGDQPEVIGGYIAGARWFRARLFAIVIPISAGAFYWIGMKHGWNPVSLTLLFGCIVVALYSQGRISWYGSPLLIHFHVRRFYQVQSIAAAGRFIGSLGLYFLGWISAFAMTMVNTLAMIWTAISYTRESRQFVKIPEHVDPHIRKEMINFLSPVIPSAVFTALQGQLLVLLISIFGRTQNIAEVAALGRLGQLFVLLAAINSALIEPYFARLSREHLLKRYLQVVGASILFGIAIATLAFLFPSPLLWILGSKYQHLDRELGWMMAGSSISYVVSVMWTIHVARKWIYWWGSFFYIFLLTIVQAFFVAFVEMQTTLSVLYLGFATNVTIMIIQVGTALYGFFSTAKATR